MRPEHIDHELPWGYWLRAQTIEGRPVFVDEETGARWHTLRSALWCGRLGMQEIGQEPPPPQLELVHAVLATRARRENIHASEEIADLFEGSPLFRAMLLNWLTSAALLVSNDHPYSEIKLTPEGWSVLGMLHATRPDSVRARRPSGMTIRDLVEVGLGPEEREERLARVEKVATSWNAAFLRQMDAGKHSVILSVRGTGPVPTKQTVWALAFETELARDNFYEWICFRMDRWEAWSEFASRYNSRELTHKLLSVMASALHPHAPTEPPKMRTQ